MSVTFPLIIIEPDPIVREGLIHVLGRRPLRIARAWSSVDAACSEESNVHDFHLALVSVTNSGALAPDEVAKLRQRCPTARIVLLVSEYSALTERQAIDTDVNGVLLRSSPPANLRKSLELIALGEGVFPMPSVRIEVDPPGMVSIAARAKESIETLSARERQVMDALAEGLPNKVIARRLCITDATVKVHVKSVLRKTGVSNRTEAALLAQSIGIGGQGMHQTVALARQIAAQTARVTSAADSSIPRSVSTATMGA